MNQTLRYTAKKILWTIPILVGITFLAFGLRFFLAYAKLHNEKGDNR